MKKLLSVCAGLLIGATSVLAAKGPEITNVEPPYWWAGMANDTLQVMVTGPGIASADASLAYPGVRLAEQVALESPNYKLLYLVVGKDAAPGTVDIKFTAKGRSTVLPYELKARKANADSHGGFDASDVLYLMMPDRFAKGGDNENAKVRNPAPVDRSRAHARHGGDIKGIENHLDYFRDLGVTALWLCPVLENDMRGGSYHGYATTDYYRIDPRFGSNDDYAAFIAKAHDKGLKVVMDMIFNHCGSDHPWLSDLPSADWLNHPEADMMTNFRLTTLHDPYVSNYDKERTVDGWFVRGMPDLNQRNPHVMKYLIQNSIWWIEAAGIDGIRMDTYPYADMEGMAEWNREVLRQYPNFNIVGECWYGNEASSAFWQRGNKINPVNTELPTVMDFFFVEKGREAFNKPTGSNDGLNKVYDHLSLDFLFPDPQHILVFLDNHDTDRFLLELPENLDTWKQAQTFLLTSRGIPQIYYGTEILMNGTKAHGDGNIRLDFPGGFPGDTVNAFVPEGRTELQNEAWNFMSKLLTWRRDVANDVIARGTLKHFMPEKGFYAYTRTLGDRCVAVIMNGTDAPLTASMERTAEALPFGAKYTDMLSGREVVIEPEMTLAPREILILQNF